MKIKKCKYCQEEIAKNAKRCPKCGGKIQVRKTKKRKNYYICENNPHSCDYISWNKPKKETANKETIDKFQIQNK